MGKERNEVETYTREVGFDQYIVYSGNNATYICIAYPGALLSQAKWSIRKLAYDSNGNMTQMRYANQTDAFDKVANDYASYNYTDI